MRLIAVAALFLLTACATEPSGTLTITLDTLPDVTAETTLAIAGSVTRDSSGPVSATVIVVRDTDTTTGTSERDGRFVVTAILRPDGFNQIFVSAVDRSGASSDRVVVEITHDDTPPSAITEDHVFRNVDPLGPVTFRFDEPVRVTEAFALRHRGMVHPGETTISSNQRAVVFTPAVPFLSNAIYALDADGVTDRAGTPANPFPGCFYTAAPPAGRLIDDSQDDVYFSGNPNFALTPPDIVTARFARDGTMITALFTFPGTRSLSPTVVENTTVHVEFDTDQNPATGAMTLKDTLFSALGPSFSSGLGADYAVTAGALASSNDSSVAGRKTGPFSIEPTEYFIPDICRSVVGFSVPLSSLGNDDGDMDIVALAVTARPELLLIDPVPNQGSVTLAFAGVAAGSSMNVANARSPRAFPSETPIRLPAVTIPFLPLRMRR